MHESMIVYPSVTTCLLLGKRLVTSGHNLTLLCPNAVFRQMAGTLASDLKIAALDAGTTVEIKSAIDCFPSMQFLSFPTLDVLPHLDLCQYLPGLVQVALPLEDLK